MAGRIAKVICIFLCELIHVIGGINFYSQDCLSENYCFSLILNQGSDRYSLSDGQTSCKSIGFKLAEISSSDLQNYTTEFIMAASPLLNNLSQSTVLINARLHENETWFWVNGKPADNITNVTENQTVATIGRKNNSFVFESASPTAANGYICQYPSTTDSCTFRNNGSCFVTCNKTKTWFSARNECLKNSGDLASLDFVVDSSGLDLLNVSVWLNQTTHYWIGLRKSWWIWNGSGSEVEYTNWNSSAQYNSKFSCIGLNYSSSSVGRWYPIDCNSTTQLHFLCLRGKKEKMTTDPTENSAPINTLGLGVGLGVCVLLLIIVVVLLVVFIIRKRLFCYDVTSSQTSDSSVGNNEANRKDTPLYSQVLKHNKKDVQTYEDNSAAAAAEAITTPASKTTFASVTSSASHDDIQGKQTVYENFDIIP